MGVKFWKKWFQLSCWRTLKSPRTFFVEDTTGVTQYKSMEILRDFLYNSALFGLVI